MVDRWNRQHLDAPILLWKIDVSQQSGAIWDEVDAWLTSGGVANKNSLMLGGAGGMIWIRSGQIVGHVVNANAATVDRLLEMTEALFGDQPQR